MQYKERLVQPVLAFPNFVRLYQKRAYWGSWSGERTCVHAGMHSAALEPNQVVILFLRPGDDDGDAIELAFSKKRVDDRKEWLSNFVPGTYLDQLAEKITYADFINKVGSRWCIHTTSHAHAALHILAV